ncbi:MAG: DUF1318 domain-containing protein [Candidatus Omnitrophica bacterium]|nr:DUF1318 domain-containing protein [Candidatus Omnitrophota bacterium]
MKKLLVFLVSLIVVFGCARVSVQAPKEPIKVDISMRLDIYQHVQKDIDAIEGIVSGGKTEAQSTEGGQSLLFSVVSCAYAEDAGLSPEVEQAALRRKARAQELSRGQAQGLIGESKLGLVELRGSDASGSFAPLVQAENEDRLAIYRALAAKNNASLESIQKVYAQRLQKDAPAGTPIEELQADGTYQWKNK